MSHNRLTIEATHSKRRNLIMALISKEKSTAALSPRLAILCKPFPRITLSLEDKSLYQTFRCKEPTLVSCLDQIAETEDTEIRYFIIRLDDKPAGALSLVTQTNHQRQGNDNAFSRIDLVMVPHPFRRLGLGRILTHAAILYAIERVGWRLYSISCLAAHQAMETILEEFGFTGQKRKDKGFVHEELKLENIDREGLRAKAEALVKKALQVTNYKLRQH